MAKDIFTPGEWRHLVERVQARTGQPVPLNQQEFFLAWMRTGSKTEAAKALNPELASPKRSGYDLAQKSGVKALLEEMTAQGVVKSDLTADVAVTMLLEQYASPDAGVRDKVKLAELALKVTGAMSDVVDHRHLHLHRTPEDMLRDYREELGEEAARRVGMRLGYSPAEVDRMIARGEEARASEARTVSRTIEVEGEEYEVLGERGASEVDTGASDVED